MKKVALSLLALALVGGAAFADASADVVKAPVTFSLDVNASVGLGTDLDTSVHGFNYDHTAAITLWFLNGTSTKEGEGSPHGYISIADVKYGTDDTTTVPALSFGDLTAKIVAGDFYLQISTIRDASVGYDNSGASIVSGGVYYRYTDAYGSTADSTNEWTSTLASYSLFGGAGVEAGYTIPSVAKFVAVVDSQTNWKAAVQQDYEYSLSVALLAVEKLTLEGKYYADAASKLSAAGATLAYDLGVVAPFADLNYNITSSAYVSDFGSKLPLADGLKAGVVGKYASTGQFDLIATVNVAADKLAGPLSADIGVRLLDVTKAVSADSTEIFAKVGLKATDVVSVGATVDTYNVAGTTNQALFLKGSLEYTGISLTTLGVYYDSSDINGKVTGTSKLGQVQAKIKIAY
jgi:hypothetical protein